MRLMISGVIAAALLLSLSGLVSAVDREPVIEELQAVEIVSWDFPPYSPLVTCQVGNLNPAAWAISNFVLPPEEYKLAFDPMATCTACPFAFKITKNHILLQTAGACTIVMSVDVEEVVYAGADCTTPGPVVCESPLYTVTLPAAGLWNVGIPITCDCLTLARKYMLSVHFESASCTPALITDAGPADLCLNWNNYGTGWYDLLGAFPTWPGQLIMFADAECCTPPVPASEKTWGAVKELYED